MGLDESVGVTMHQPPPRLLAAVDQGHPQRPVLGRQSADVAVLPLDQDENHHVVRHMSRDDLQLGLAAAEELDRFPTNGCSDV